MESPFSLVAGGTGLVGGHVLNSLSKLSGSQIILSRSFQSKVPKNAQVQIIDFNDLFLNKVKLKNKIDHVYLCLGKKLSTIELGYMQHGSRKSFKLIDYEYPLSVAKLAFNNGARSISLVSAVGAKEGPFNYYFHIKGKLENKIKEIGFKNISFARPGHLLGKRHDFRGFEIPFLETGLSIASPFMLGPIKNFKQIEANKVAESMVMHARRNKSGVSYLYYKDFLKTDIFE